MGFPYSTQCSAALPHRHFGEGIDQVELLPKAGYKGRARGLL